MVKFINVCRLVRLQYRKLTWAKARRAQVYYHLDQGVPYRRGMQQMYLEF